MAFKTATERRRLRVRRAIKAAANGRVRLTVHRSNFHIYAQVIDGDGAKVLASASSAEPEMRQAFKNGGNKQAAAEISRCVGYMESV